MRASRSDIVVIKPHPPPSGVNNAASRGEHQARSWHLERADGIKKRLGKAIMSSVGMKVSWATHASSRGGFCARASSEISSCNEGRHHWEAVALILYFAFIALSAVQLSAFLQLRALKAKIMVLVLLGMLLNFI